MIVLGWKGGMVRRHALILGLAAVSVCGILWADDALLQHLRRERAFVQAEIDRLSEANDTEPEPAGKPVRSGQLQPGNLQYLGAFLPPLRTAEDAAAPDGRYRQFAYSPGHACLGPNGGLLMPGHSHRCYVAEITIPEPSKDNPPRAEFIQPFANLVRPGVDQPRIAGLLWVRSGESGVPQDVADAASVGSDSGSIRGRLYLTLERHYNVAHRQFPSLCWGPGDLSKHVSEGTGLLWVRDSRGRPVDFERVAANMFVSPWGLAYCNQGGKHEAKSDGPALATFEPGEDAAGNFRQLLFYERGSGVFPDPPNRWNETCRVHGAAVIDGTIVCAGSVGLATGLPELTGRNYFYGGPGEYPVEGINVCRGPAAKGYHAPPYEGRLWFFDAEEIAAAERPSDPMPYAIVNLSSPELLGPNGGCGQSPGSIVWDEQRQRIYLPCGGANPVIHVFGMKKK
jgi:hypothetical protein